MVVLYNWSLYDSKIDIGKPLPDACYVASLCLFENSILVPHLLQELHLELETLSALEFLVFFCPSLFRIYLKQHSFHKHGEQPIIVLIVIPVSCLTQDCYENSNEVELTTTFSNCSSFVELVDN